MSRFSNVHVDPVVVSRLMRGDRQAQETVYRAYANPVYTMARRILRDEGLAEEATQDTFVDVLTGAASLERPAALAGWIRTIAVNQCLMRLRSPWHQRRQALGEHERATNDATRAIDIDQALGRLSDDARMVVWLHCIEGYTHDEIGAAFGRTASFSKSQLARAYRALAAQSGATARSGQRATEVHQDDRSAATVAGRGVGAACAV